MTSAHTDEWKIIEGLLPSGWEDAAREQKAFRRVRYTSAPGALLRLLLFHAVSPWNIGASTEWAFMENPNAENPVPDVLLQTFPVYQPNDFFMRRSGKNLASIISSIPGQWPDD